MQRALQLLRFLQSDGQMRSERDVQREERGRETRAHLLLYHLHVRQVVAVLFVDQLQRLGAELLVVDGLAVLAVLAAASSGQPAPTKNKHEAHTDTTFWTRAFCMPK